MTAEILALVAFGLAVLLGIGWYLSYTAVRLDRLHTRLDATAAALDLQVVRRAECAVETAYGAELDPASATLLLDAARMSLEHEGPWTPRRQGCESAMTGLMRLVLPENGGFPEMEECAMRVRLARRFHNEAVAQTRSVRRRRVVRVLRLAGHTDLPEPVDFDDGWPNMSSAQAA
ncbi:MAG: hypothetical protein WA892_00355 [Ornithinimicrobium sp.]